MSRDFPDDEFGRRLHDVLHSRASSISPDAGALERIHAGARRRQRRHRATVSGGAALAVIAVAAVGVTLRPTHHGGSQLAGGPSSTAATSATARPTVSDLPSPVTPTVAPSSNTFTATGPASSNFPTIPAGGAPPKGFVPTSVTAVSTATYWVLGHAPCPSISCPAVAKTSDGGKTFTEVGAPGAAVGPDDPQSRPKYGSNLVTDIRFGDGKNGWAFGGEFWQTTDGGLTWSPVVVAGATQQFAVEQLAAANNRAWAIALTGSSADTGAVYAVYSATYPGGSWQKVDSAGTFGSAEPILGVEGTTAVVIGTDATTGKQRAVIATGGSTGFAQLPGNLPCTYAPGEAVSTTTNALWLACTSFTGTIGGVYFSPDFGRSWQVASSALDVRAQPVAIGGVDDKSAIVATGGKLLRVNVDGSTASVSTVNLPSATQFAFIGFTTAKDGFAMPIVNGTRQLWRTTDGGDHWSVVKF